jgi:hypothetical protein
VGQRFNELKALIDQGLNRQVNPHLSLKGSLSTLRLDGLEVLPDRFRVDASLEGQVQVTVKAGS